MTESGSDLDSAAPDPAATDAAAGHTPSPSGQFVQSLARGLGVIRAFDVDHPEMTLSDIARRAGLTRATSRRFLLTLVELGYVRSDGRHFSLTAKVLDLGFSYLSALSLPEIAQPHLEELASIIHESTSLSVLDGTDVVYVARVPARRIMSVRISIGTRFPAYATSMGRVMLAALDRDGLDAYLAHVGIAPLTSHTIGNRDELVAQLAEVRERGWALIDQELEEGLRSIAVPIRHGSEVVAAINVSTSTSSRTIESIHRDLLPHLQRAAERISADLSASRPYASARAALIRAGKSPGRNDAMKTG
ncbi:MAG: IclR family transcriptional regulator [Microbacteriaceae bacterium]|nr:MAG: IclR family transcriptional regulator [Microbacteriaceae bacterium]